MSPNKTITIMAENGIGDYGWIKEASEQTRYVGSNIAGVYGFPDDYEISDLLTAQFKDWILDFERHCGEPGFDWEAFNAKGKQLAESLSVELEGKYHVLYRAVYS